MLCVIRLYVCLKLFRVIVDHRMRRMWKTYKNVNLYFFLYKSLLNQSSILLYIFINLFWLVLFMFLYKPSHDIYGDSISLVDSLWVVGQTVMGTGYGDFFPQTIPSQVLCVFIVYIGKYFMASFELAMIYSVNFNEEKEIKAYQQIKMIGNKEDKSNSYNIYFENYIKYKMMKVRNVCRNVLSLKGRIDDREKEYDSIRKMLVRRNTVKIIKERYFLRVLSTLRTETTVTDFISYVKTKMDSDANNLIDKYQLVVFNMYKYNCFFVDTISEYTSTVTDTFFLSNQIANLCFLIYWTGCKFNIDNHRNINRNGIVDNKSFEIKLREFHLLFRDRIPRHKAKKSFGYFYKTKNSKGSETGSFISGYNNINWLIPFKTHASYSSSDNFEYYDDEEDDEDEEPKEKIIKQYKTAEPHSLNSSYDSDE